jgi:hypothetical protein
MEIFIAHIIFTIIVYILLTLLGSILYLVTDYASISDIFKADSALGFNTTYRILSVPITVTLISITLYMLKLEKYIPNIWLVSVYYFVFQYVLIRFILNREKLFNQVRFVVLHLASILITYGFYSLAIVKGLEFLLPDQANFRTEIWFIVIIFFYETFRNITENSQAFDNRKRNYIKTHYEQFKQQYNSLLDEKDKDFKQVLYSIMIFENFARPKAFRILERLLFRTGIVKTSGLMQVKSKKHLSDKESVEKAISIIEEVYETPAPNSYFDPSKIFYHYNSSHDYVNKVKDVYYVITSLDYEPPIYYSSDFTTGY